MTHEEKVKAKAVELIVTFRAYNLNDVEGALEITKLYAIMACNEVIHTFVAYVDPEHIMVKFYEDVKKEIRNYA